MISTCGDDTIQFLLAARMGLPMDRATALRTAAWIVALCDPLQRDFPGVLEAICNT